MSVGEPEKRETRAGPTVAVMQPYFMPYIGYYQLIAAADLFVVYDQIKYTKKGWINRNRMLVDGRDAVFTLPLRHDDDAKDVADRQVAETFDPDKLLRRMAAAYRRAPCFTETFAFLERVLGCPERNLFRFLFASLQEACRHLGITTELRPSSAVASDRSLTGQERVLDICRATGAAVYVNAIGGVSLYSREAFADRGVTLRFLRPAPFEYRQFGDDFVPWLSIIDVLMFNPPAVVRARLESGYELV